MGGRAVVRSLLLSRLLNSGERVLRASLDRSRLKLNNWLLNYEELIGVKEIRLAQARVLNAEEKFMGAQEERRKAQEELNRMQVRLREVRSDLDRTPRGDENYLELVKSEIELVREERKLRTQFEWEEKKERDLFAGLSSALRSSHETERGQAEKTKYWSLFGSLFGAALGILGTMLSSHFKLRQLKEATLENTRVISEGLSQKLDVLVAAGAPTTSTSTVVQADGPSPSKVEESLKALLTQLQEESLKTQGSASPSYLLTSMERRRQQELLGATLLIIVLVPLLVLRFSS